MGEAIADVHIWEYPAGNRRLGISGYYTEILPMKL